MAQNMVVAMLVGCCFVYALWTLAPKALRSRLASALLKLPLPSMLQGPLLSAARLQGGCGCDGCDRSVSAKARPGQAPAGVPVRADFQPVTFVRGYNTKKTQR